MITIIAVSMYMSVDRYESLADALINFFFYLCFISTIEPTKNQSTEMYIEEA